MQIDKQSMLELAEIVSKSVVNALKENGIIGSTPTQPKSKEKKSAYAKTEQLLFTYNGFKRIIEERKQEVEDIRKYGVPQKSAMSGGERVQTSRTVQGIVLPEESVDIAVRNVERSVERTVQAVALIDKCLDAIKTDQYYEIIPMRYFEGRTLEDIGLYFGCDHSTISRNKNRLVRELSMRLFPDEVIEEFMN